MKNTKLILTLFFIFVSSQSLAANLTGTWSGPGGSQTAQSYRECSEVFFRFEDSPTELKILNGGYICQELQAEYPYSVFEKKAGELLYRNEVVGSYTPNGFVLDAPEEFYRLEVELVEDGLQTQEVWDDSQSFLKVFGMLEKI